MNITPEQIQLIEHILKRGNTAELKREKGNLVIIEIQRKVKNKTAING